MLALQKHLVSTLGIITASIPVNAHTQNESKQRQNILFILVDDMGWNDLGFSGSKYYETPNIDKLASEGIVFTQAYAACSVSSPSRASILTGQAPTRHGITNWIGEASGEAWRGMGRNSKLLPASYAHSLPSSEITIAEYLKDSGYKTFFCGKWHLGSEGSMPTDHGFDINIAGYDAGSPSGYFSPYKNPLLSDGPKGEELSMRLAVETANFMQKQQETNKDQPFFAYLSFYAVHGPIQTTQNYWSYFRNKAEKMGIAPTSFIFDRTQAVRQTQDNPVYAGLVKQMDDAIGVLMQRMKAQGLDKNTLIIFTSDNGGVSSGDAYSTSCLPLRGGKGRQWEGGVREPLIISYPNCKKGTTIKKPVIAMDFYPTILEYVGLPLLPKQHVDGISLMPLINGKETKERTFYWHYPHYGNQGGEPSSYIRKGDWKLIHYYEDGHDELYNLAMDVTESKSLNTEYPAKVKELSADLATWLKETKAKLPIKDPLYDANKEALQLSRKATDGVKQQENFRKKMLQNDYKPNPTWWGSRIDN